MMYILPGFLVICALVLLHGEGTPIVHDTDKLGAVASESAICSNIGIELLKSGGNAADAMVGTTLCVGVVGMYHSGIGGGGFALVRGSDGQYESIDFRETAPAAAHENMYENFTTGSLIGGLAVGVPGDIRGLEYLHKKYGVLPWQVVCNPAVHIARYGFPVTEDLVKSMEKVTLEHGNNNFLVDDPSWAIDFAPKGSLLQLGETITRKRYANTLDAIAREGAEAFYEGLIANGIIAAIQAANGTMTLQDLSGYTILAREPIQIDYHGYKLYSTGIPSSGAVTLSTLKIIECYDMSNETLLNLNTHRLDEAIKFAYGMHNGLGDPDFSEGMSVFEAEMLKPSTAAHIRSRISDCHTKNVSEYNPEGLSTPETHGTSHIVTADASGLSISLTSTINLLFGSKLIVPDSGIILNNEMNDFSISHASNHFGYAPSPINFIRPGKRPLSSITPVIVEYPDGELYLSVGAAGGSRIITATIQGLWHVLDHGLNMPAALLQPRLHDQLLPNVVSFEYEYDNETTAFMTQRGHNTTWVPKGKSTVHGIRRLRNGTFEAAAEPRQKNSAGFAI